MLALDAVYWKPVQSGSEDGTDTARVRAMTGLPEDRFLPEAYVLRSPLSPHRAAELDGKTIDPSRLALPRVERPLVVEAAGGLLVPITRSLLQIDVIARWKAPVVLCARTALGTINHSLLSIESLRRRGIPLLGIAFIGEANEDSETTIVALGETRRLGRLPMLPKLGRAELRQAFDAGFSVGDFAPAAARA